MLLVLLALVPATAQQYRFPATDAQLGEWYPTAYRDHGGVDWSCGDIRYSGHRGSDFGGGGFTGMDEGRDVVAAAPGIVMTVEDGHFDRCTTADCAGGGGFGNYVKLRHPDGLNTYYAHLRDSSIAVAEGDFVSCGALLGQMGSSGHSTGPHLHFEVRDIEGASYEPFQGSCSGTDFSMWVDQGSHGGLPSTTCDTSFPSCEPVERLTCGARIDARNDDPGHTDRHQMYGCTTAVYTGPELAYTVVTDRDEPIALRLSGLSDDLDVMVLESTACLGGDCVLRAHADQTDDEAIAWDATSAVEYTIVVDGWQGAVSDFHLEIDCEGADPQGQEPGDSGQTDTGSDGGRIPSESSGCGCSTSPSAPGLPFVMFVSALGWRRRCTIAS